MKVIVYFETKNHSYAEPVAMFNDESLYHMCFGALEQKARQVNMVVTESIREDEFLTDKEQA